MEPVIKFKQYRITKIDYKAFDDIEELEKHRSEHGNLKLSVAFSEEKDKARVIVETSVIDLEERRMASIEITGYFEINPEMDIENTRRFLQVNGTAILFPYIRTIVSFITSLDNEKAIILPTINTTDFGEDDNSED